MHVRAVRSEIGWTWVCIDGTGEEDGKQRCDYCSMFRMKGQSASLSLLPRAATDLYP
jgi:hypothetical protein